MVYVKPEIVAGTLVVIDHGGKQFEVRRVPQDTIVHKELVGGGRNDYKLARSLAIKWAVQNCARFQ